MFYRRWARVILAALWLVAPGCTALRELPRSQYAAQAERKYVKVETGDGLRYEFDHAHFGQDSLTGYRRRDQEGVLEEYDALGLPYDALSRVSVRRIDWYRTGLVGGVGLAVLLGAALTRSNNGGGGGDDGGVKPPPVAPRP